MTDRRLPKPPAESAQIERFASAWTAVSSGTPLADVLAEVADDAELVALVQLAIQASSILPATVGKATRARQAAALRDLVPTERGHGVAAARPAAAADGTDRRGRTGEARGRRAAGGPLWQLWLGGRPRFVLRLTAAVLAVALGLGSSVVAAADDVPGDTLYGVKRAAESARMALTFDPGRRASFHLELAEIRIAEIRALINRGRNPSARVVEALIAQLSSAERDAALAQDRALIDSVSAARVMAARSLGELAGQAPGETASVLNDGIAALAPAPQPPTGRPHDQAPPHVERGRPSPTADVALTPTSAGLRGDAAPQAGATAPPATERRPYVAAPTVVPATAPSVDATQPGQPPGAGDGALPPSVGAAAPTSAPPPEPTEPPPPPAAPTVENPFTGQRSETLTRQPPEETKAPPRTPRRP